MSKTAQKLSSEKRKRLITLTLLLSCGATFYFLLLRLGFLMPIQQIPQVLCFSNCPEEKPIHPVLNSQPQTENPLNYQKPLKDILDNNIEKEKLSILIEKSQYRLTLYYQLKPVKSYPVVFGGTPTGDKRSEGDQKTPEGIIYTHW